MEILVREILRRVELQIVRRAVLGNVENIAGAENGAPAAVVPDRRKIDGVSSRKSGDSAGKL